jgi:DNA-directed RNA polymerase subunit L
MQAHPRPDNEEGDDHDDMPVLLKNEDHALGNFLGWLPKY